MNEGRRFVDDGSRNGRRRPWSLAPAQSDQRAESGGCEREPGPLASRKPVIDGLDDLSIACEVDEEALQPVPHRKHREERARSWPAASDGVDDEEKHQRTDEVVDRRVMDDRTGGVVGRFVAGRDVSGRWNLVAEEESRRTTEVVGDEDVADASKDHADDKAGSRRVERERDVEAAAPEVGQAEDEAAYEPTEHRKSAFPDGNHVAPRFEVIHVAENVEAAGADDRAEGAPCDGVVDLGARNPSRLGPACHEVGAGEEAESGAEAVG